MVASDRQDRAARLEAADSQAAVRLLLRPLAETKADLWGFIHRHVRHHHLRENFPGARPGPKRPRQASAYWRLITALGLEIARARPH
jgi:hypothetical protein